MTDPNRSPLAALVGDLHPDPPRAGRVFGLAVHCTGRSIVERARRRGEDPLEHALAYYQAASCSCHYLVDYDGAIYQITADDRRVPHIGVSAEERQLYLRTRDLPNWQTCGRLPRAVVERWRSHWTAWRSPQHLFPGTSANAAYVGVELLPSLVTKAHFDLWYTDAQHEAVARLALDVARRHGFEVDLRLWVAPGGRALPCPRLLGHEDLDAFGRWDKGGGWDPGALRARPRFDWSAVRTMIAAAP